MTRLVIGAFLVSTAFLAWVYAGYPLLLLIRAALQRRTEIRGSDLPFLSVLVAAYNEEDAIGDRIENVRAQRYPSDRVEIVVASDGSDDATVRIAREHGVRVLDLPRQGKIPALHEAVMASRGGILVFTDANTVMRPDALSRIAERFADQEVGGVAGNTGYKLAGNADASGYGEKLYWGFDTWLKDLESRSGSVVSAHGGLYAIRRQHYARPPEAGVTDDFFISTGVICDGRRLVFAPDAVAYEYAVARSDLEFSRRIRLMTRGWRSLYLRRELMNPFRSGFYSVSLVSRKLLRRLAPLALVVLFVSNLYLAPLGGFWMAGAAVQIGFYGLAAVGLAARGSSWGRRRMVYVPFFFTMANLASVIALLRFLRGDRIGLWQPQRHATAPEVA